MKSVIIDYGSGNLHSIRHKLIKVGIDACISNKKDDVKKADVIIISGVGHFSRAMENMRQNNLIDILNNKVLIDKTPVLGICLGMQLFTKFSEEGDVNGFGWLDANTCLFKFSKNIYKIPHIGWNLIKHKKISTLLNNIDSKQRFYFVHSYHVSCNNKDDILTTTTYGGIDFVSSVEKDNIFGTQFHPEKSHKKGMDIIKNFFEYIQSKY